MRARHGVTQSSRLALEPERFEECGEFGAFDCAMALTGRLPSRIFMMRVRNELYRVVVERRTHTADLMFLALGEYDGEHSFADTTLHFFVL